MTHYRGWAPRSGAIAFVLGAALAESAAAQTRPLVTEEAWTAPPGTIVFETGADAMRAVPNFLTAQPRTRLDLPLLRVVFSPSDNVELDVEWIVRVIARNDTTFGDASDYGDVSLRAKTRLWHDRRSALSARFTVTLPETNQARGLGPNTLRMNADLLWSIGAGPARLHFNGGLAIQDRPLQAHEQSDFLSYGAAAEFPLAPRLTGVAEIAGLRGSGAPGADEHSELRGGIRYDAGALTLDAAVRRGLLDADGTWGLTAGLRLRLR